MNFFKFLFKIILLPFNLIFKVIKKISFAPIKLLTFLILLAALVTMFIKGI